MTTHTQTEAKSTSTLIPAMQPAHSSLLPQLELEEPARSLLPTVDWLRLPNPPTQPPINPSVGHSFGSMAIGSPSTPMLQRKLAIGQPNDQYEQEAFRVANQIMIMSDAKSLQPIQRQNDEEEEEEKPKNYGPEDTSDIRGDQKDEQKLVPSVRYKKGKWNISLDIGKGEPLKYPTQYPHKAPPDSPFNNSLTRSIEKAKARSIEKARREKEQLQEKKRLLEEEMRRKEKEFRQQNWGNDFPLPRPEDEATAYG